MLTFQIASDTEHDNVVAEINHGDDFLCLLSKEDVDDAVMIELPIELPTTGPESLRRMRLDEFISLVDRAKKQLVDPE